MSETVVLSKEKKIRLTYFVKIVKSTLLATNSNYLLSRRTRKKGFMKFVGNTVLKCKIMYKYTKKNDGSAAGE